MKPLGSAARRASVAVVLLLLACPRAALAANYRSTLARGVEARDRAEETSNPEDWNDALEAFDEAGQLELTKEAKFEFAGAAAHLGLDDEACSAYSESLYLGLTGKAATVAQAYVDSYRNALAMIQLTGPAGAVVSIAQRKRATLPLTAPLFVHAGAVVVQLDARGFQPWVQNVSLRAGDIKFIAVQMLPIAPRQSALLGSSSPTSDRPSMSTVPPSPQHWGAPVSIAGGGLAVLGTAMAVVTSLLLPRDRNTLANNCVVRQGDDCAKATANKQAAAQSAANDISTEKNLRWVGVGSTLVGLGALTVGLVRLETVEKRAPRAQAAVGASAHDLTVELGLTF